MNLASKTLLLAAAAVSLAACGPNANKPADATTTSSTDNVDSSAKKATENSAVEKNNSDSTENNTDSDSTDNDTE